MDINLSLEQKQILSLKQTISVTILSLGSLELKEYIQKECLENPVIEPDSVSFYMPDRKSANCGSNTDYMEILNGEEDTTSLIDHLILQIKLSGTNSHFMQDCAAVCAFVENSGYIYTPVNDIAKFCNISEQRVQNAVDFIKTLEPAGVGAQSVGECLCLQLDKADTLAMQIAKNHLQLLASGKIKEIAEKTNSTKEAVQQASEKIRHLNPKPGLEYGIQSKAVYIMPDITVTIENGKPVVCLAREKETDIFISPSYIQLLKTSKDEQARDYLQKKLDKAMWLKQCIESRNKTLLAVAQSVVARQEQFFLTGQRQMLLPLKQEDIATDISMHISTVSRAVKDKYIQYPFGIIPLKNMFIGGISHSDGSVTGTEFVKEKIRNIVENEDKAFPVSDQKISDILKETGIVCSRRTVAKYREAMNILPSSQR